MTGVRTGRPARHPLERFLEKCEPGLNDCVVWTGTKSSDGDGYGVFKAAGRLWRAHRWAYTQFVGLIPAGLTIDHLCRNRLCVNPMHLEAVTNRENVLRGDGPSARAARKTTCNAGHPLDGFTYGSRYCKTCHRHHEAVRRERKRVR